MQGLVTVVGGSGFIGRYAVRALAKAGWRIRVAMRRPHLAPELRVMGDVGQIELVPANLRDGDSLRAALDGAEASVNLVGVLFESGRQSFQSVHVEGAGAWARAAVAAGCERLVHVSAIGADADSPSLYARTKALGEAAVRDAAPDAVVLRPSVVFGEEDQFFNRFASMAALSPALPLIGGGRTRFQPVYVADVGQAVAAAVRTPPPGGSTFELGGPKTYTFREILEVILRETRRRRILLPIPFPAAEALGSTAQIAALAGIAPPLTRDQVELLKRDNVASGPGLSELGIVPTAIDAVLPTFLWKYRRGGQFAVPTA